LENLNSVSNTNPNQEPKQQENDEIEEEKKVIVISFCG
jgi:hypothetical protein